MGLIKEPKNIDFSTKSEPWTEEELVEFRKFMSKFELKNTKTPIKSRSKSAKARSHDVT